MPVARTGTTLSASFLLETDLPALLTHATSLSPPGTDLAPPPLHFTWPVHSHQEALHRMRLAVSQYRRRMREDPSVRFVKVVEKAVAASGEGTSDKGEKAEEDTIGLARWHFYPEGLPLIANKEGSPLKWERAEIPEGGFGGPGLGPGDGKKGKANGCDGGVSGDDRVSASCVGGRCWAGSSTARAKAEGKDRGANCGGEFTEASAPASGMPSREGRAAAAVGTAKVGKPDKEVSSNADSDGSGEGSGERGTESSHMSSCYSCSSNGIHAGSGEFGKSIEDETRGAGGPDGVCGNRNRNDSDGKATRERGYLSAPPSPGIITSTEAVVDTQAAATASNPSKGNMGSLDSDADAGASRDRDATWKENSFSFCSSSSSSGCGCSCSCSRWPRAFNRRLHDHILVTNLKARERWIPGGQPCWVLTGLVTRSDRRGRGAAGLLLRWGLDRAAEMGLGVYLEAGVQGKPIYERFGFLQVGELVGIDCRSFGMDFVFELANMVCWPRGKLTRPERGGEGEGGDGSSIADGESRKKQIADLSKRDEARVELAA